MLSNDNIRHIYEETLLGEDPVLLPDDIQMQYIRLFLPEETQTTILDAGCGNGKYALQLVRDGYKNIYAVDLFENIKTDRFVYQQASIDNLPFDESFFDFVYCNSVIFYLPNPGKGIIEFKRVLKNGGILFITAHTKYSLFTMWRCIKLLAGLKSVRHLKGVRFYTAKQYAIWLEKSGFEIIRIDGYNISFFIYPFYRKFVRASGKLLGIKTMPLLTSNKITRSRLMAKLKSIFGYHSIIVAKKGIIT